MKRIQSKQTKTKKLAIWMALATIPTMANAETTAPAEDLLPEVSVTSTKDADIKFKAEKSSTATKTDTDLRDIPQSISVVTEELIESQRAFNLRDALRNVSGLSIAAGEGGRTGDSITLRGFSASSDIYLDGVKDNGQYNRDTFFLDKVEVLKGASSIMFGRGSTGGVINQTTKSADGKEHLEANLSYGSFDNKRVTIDAGTKLNEVVSVRLNALVQDSDSFRDENFVRRQGIAPSVNFKFSDRTDLTLNYLYQNEDSAYDYGVPMFRGRPADVPRDRYYGFKDDMLQEYETNVATAVFNHAFTDDFSVKNTTRYGDYYRKYRSQLINSIDNVNGTFVFREALRDSNQENLINQTDFVLKTPIAGMPNTLAFGLELGKEDFDFRSKASRKAGNQNFNVPISIFNPSFPDTWGIGRADDFSNLVTTGASNNKDQNRKVKVDTKAVYVQDQLEITKQWKLLAGIRYDHFEADQTDYITPANSAFDSSNHAWSPRTGLVWQPTDNQSYYVSYGESFNPTAEQFGNSSETSAKLKPEENRNIEVGTKIELFDGKASFTSALYQLDKTNARQTDPNDSTRTILGGETRVRGLEFGLAGEVAENFNLSAAYAYMDSEVVKSTSTANSTVSTAVNISTQGMELANVPRHSGTVWATYKLPQNWEIGGGVFASGDRFTDSIEEVKLPGYMRLDAVVAYHQPKYDVQFNLYNLLNKKYYESGQNRSALPGIPLSGMVTVSLKY